MRGDFAGAGTIGGERASWRMVSATDSRGGRLSHKPSSRADPRDARQAPGAGTGAGISKAGRQEPPRSLSLRGFGLLFLGRRDHQALATMPDCSRTLASIASAMSG